MQLKQETNEIRRTLNTLSGSLEQLKQAAHRELDKDRIEPIWFANECFRSVLDTAIDIVKRDRVEGLDWRRLSAVYAMIDAALDLLETK